MRDEGKVAASYIWIPSVCRLGKQVATDAFSALFFNLRWVGPSWLQLCKIFLIKWVLRKDGHLFIRLVLFFNVIIFSFLEFWFSSDRISPSTIVTIWTWNTARGVTTWTTRRGTFLAVAWAFTYFVVLAQVLKLFSWPLRCGSLSSICFLTVILFNCRWWTWSILFWIQELLCLWVDVHSRSG